MATHVVQSAGSGDLAAPRDAVTTDGVPPARLARAFGAGAPAFVVYCGGAG